MARGKGMPAASSVSNNAPKSGRASDNWASLPTRSGRSGAASVQRWYQREAQAAAMVGIGVVIGQSCT